MDKLTLSLSDLQVQLLQEGYNIKVPVNGYSMFPLLLPGDRVLIAPASPENLIPGEIALFRQGSHLVAHRIVTTDHTSSRFYTKGDSNLQNDVPINAASISGKITACFREKKHRPIKVRKMMLFLSRLRYPLFFLKWFYLKMRHISARLKQKGIL